MRLSIRRYANRQDGYTLVELIISLAIGAVLMSALMSVLLTTSQAASTATSRIDASSQVRSFQQFAYQDFASSSLPSGSGSCTVSIPCSTPIALSSVTYSWDGSSQLSRVPAGGGTRPAATNVQAFSWYVTGCTVVVSITVTVQAYSQSQTFQFYPRVNCP